MSWLLVCQNRLVDTEGDMADSGSRGREDQKGYRSVGLGGGGRGHSGERSEQQAVTLISTASVTDTLSVIQAVPITRPSAQEPLA